MFCHFVVLENNFKISVSLRGENNKIHLLCCSDPGFIKGPIPSEASEAPEPPQSSSLIRSSQILTPGRESKVMTDQRSKAVEEEELRREELVQQIADVLMCCLLVQARSRQCKNKALLLRDVFM